jgi:hypothetical protein
MDEAIITMIVSANIKLNGTDEAIITMIVEQHKLIQ